MKLDMGMCIVVDARDLVNTLDQLRIKASELRAIATKLNVDAIHSFREAEGIELSANLLERDLNKAIRNGRYQ